jgi:hypothetical protein
VNADVISFLLQEITVSEAEVTSAISQNDRSQMMTELLTIFQVCFTSVGNIAPYASCMSHAVWWCITPHLLLGMQEVKYEPGEELHTSRSRASEEAAILLIVAGHIETVLMPPAAQSSAGGSACRDLDEAGGGGGGGSTTNSGDDFSLDGDIIGALPTASMIMLYGVCCMLHAACCTSWTDSAILSGCATSPRYACMQYGPVLSALQGACRWAHSQTCYQMCHDPQTWVLAKFSCSHVALANCSLVSAILTLLIAKGEKRG